MKKKIVGFFICMLLLTTVVSTVSSMNKIKNIMVVESIINQSLTLADWNEAQKLLASDGATIDYFGLSVSICGDYAIIGAIGDDDMGSYSGSAYVFKRSGTSWSQEAKLVASDGEANDDFGISVSISGDYAIIGAHYDNVHRGSAYVFKRSGTSWIQEAKLVASDVEVGDTFGFSVSISGDYAVIGSPVDDSSRGSAYVFKRSGTSWIQEAKLVASDGEAYDCFGWSVSISGDYTVIGGYGDDTGHGSAYVFKRSGTSWSQEAKLVTSDGRYFGWSVSINNDYAVIGSIYYDTGRGSAYVFKRSGTSWSQEAKLVASDGENNDDFGRSVSIYSDYTVIGAHQDDSCRGSAYVFKRSGTSWSQEAKLVASDGADYDFFGGSVSTSGNNILIGAYGSDNIFGTDAGSAYIFKRPNPDLDCSGTLSWTNVKAGGTVYGQFIVINIGEPTSKLSWKIDSYPEWGTWSIMPSSGSGLTPEMGAINIAVEVIAPNENNQQFTGEIKIVNTDYNSDYDIITVSLKTPINHPMISQQFLQFLQNFLINQNSY